MKFNSTLRLLVLITAVLAFAGVASAQGIVYDSGSTYSNLAMTATVQTALNLEISTHASGATVSGTEGSGSYALNFGNVNGLGLGTPSTNVTKTAVSGGFLYTTPITLTPSFSGFAETTATIKVHQPAADGAAAVAMAREGSTDEIDAGTLPATATSFTTAASNGTAITRYVGVKVLNGNAGATYEAGLRTMNLIYTISVP
jgi:hypothetical protein